MSQFNLFFREPLPLTASDTTTASTLRKEICATQAVP